MKKVEKCKNFLKKHRFIRMAMKMELPVLVLVLTYYWLFDGGKNEIEFILVAYHVVLLALPFLKALDSKMESKLTEKQNAEDLARVKEKFALKEGELVEVLFTPSADAFAMKLFLGIQQEIKTRYFALLEEETISIIPMLGCKKLKPERMGNPRTLEFQFTPMPKENEDIKKG